MKKRYSRVGIKFDTDFLIQLSETPDSGVEIVNYKYHLAIHPYQLNDFNNSLKEELLQKVPEYDKKLQGVVLGFKNIKLADDLAVINYDSPFIHADILADFFVFKPDIGKEFKGIVTKTTADHVGCLVYNSFNVSLPKYECPNWIGGSVGQGDEVSFKITFIDTETKFIYIRGQLLEIVKSNSEKQKSPNKKIKFEDEQSEELMEATPQKKKKKNKKHEQSEVIENSIDTTHEDNQTENKKKKKQKHKEKINDSIEKETLINNNEAKKYKKQKIKKEPEEEEVTLDDLDLSSLFNFQKDKSEKSSRKRSKSMSQTNIKIEPMSEVEGEDLNESTSNKKRKRSMSEAGSPIKKKHKKSQET